MGDEVHDNELHMKTGEVELIRDWKEGASANEFRIIVYRAGTNLYGSFTKTEFNNLEAKSGVSRLAYNVAAADDMSTWSSMTAAEKTDSYNAFKAPALYFLRLHKASVSLLSPTNIADSTVTATEIVDFEDAADISESDFTDEVDASSAGTWFSGLASSRRSEFASNFANR